MTLIARLFVLFAFVAAAPAAAQSFPTPVDVPEYVEVTPTYATGTDLNVIGDNSSTGGWAPAWDYQLTDIPTADRASLLDATSGPSDETTLTGGPGAEAKFRTHINFTTVLFDDPIRNWSEPGQSHCHSFFSNKEPNSFSTHATLRTLTGSSDGSVAQGLMLNATGYWIPCMIKTDPFGDGKDYVVPFPYGVVYYAVAPSQAENAHPIPNGLRYVGGLHMDDPYYYRDLVASANAAHTAAGGTGTRYYVHDNLTSDEKITRHSWVCNGSRATVLNDGGADPFAGSCSAGMDLRLELDFPRCWDGTNLWSPGGYKHVIYEIYDYDTGGMVCPTGWYRFPRAELNIAFKHNGPDDYKNWRASSDDALAATLGTTVQNGYSMHSDWMDGWDETTRNQWMKYCIGSGLLWAPSSPVPHSCSDSVISATEKLIDRPTPQTVDTNDASTLIPIPTLGAGGTVHGH